MEPHGSNKTFKRKRKRNLVVDFLNFDFEVIEILKFTFIVNGKIKYYNYLENGSP